MSVVHLFFLRHINSFHPFLKAAFWPFPILFITDETHADTCESYIRRKIVFETKLPAVLHIVLIEDFEV